MLTTNQPVLASQVVSSNDCAPNQVTGDPNLLNLVPSDYRIKEAASENLMEFSTFVNNFEQRYVTLLTETSAVPTVLLNGNSLTNQFVPFPGEPGLSYARLSLPVGASYFSSSRGFLAYAYGVGDYDAYTYHLGFDKDEFVSVDVSPNDKEPVIFPNPASDQVHLLDFPGHPKQVEVLDFNGRLVYSGAWEADGSGAGVLRLGHLTEGSYWLRVVSDDQVTVRKLLIVR